MKPLELFIAIALILVIASAAQPGERKGLRKSAYPGEIARAEENPRQGKRPSPEESSWLAESAWPMFRHDLRHTGRTPYTGPAEPTLKWIFPTGAGIASSPSLGEDGTIYVGSGYNYTGADSNLYAINTDGSLKWSFKTGGSIFSSPAVGADGTVYFGSMDGHLYAVEDSVTYGKFRWKAWLGSWVYSSPAVGADGTVYAGGLDFHLYAINPDGGLKWRWRTDWCVFSSPAIGPGGEIYVGSKDHRLYAFEDSVTYGKVAWKYAAGTFYDGHLVDSSPAIGPDGTIYVGTDPYGAAGQAPVPVDTVFFAINPDGSLKWKFFMEDGAESSPAVGPGGMIYIGSYDGNLYAVRDGGHAGVLEWTFPTGGAIDGSPTVDGCGTIYVGSRDSTLYAVNPDGTERWRFRTGGGIECSPTIDDSGILYIGSLDGNLYALGSGGPDAGVVSIDLPGEVEAGSTHSPGAAVRNCRSGSPSFLVSCRIDTAGVPVYADTIGVEGLSGTAPYDVTFAPWTAGPDTGTVYTVTVATYLAGDGNSHNDTLTAPTVTTAGTVTGSDGAENNPHPPFSLGQCYPNPFNPATTIRFGLMEAGNVALRIYDVSGRLVRVLAEGRRGAGRHSVTWDGTDGSGGAVSSGVYFYSLSAGPFKETRKMVMLR